MASYRPLGQFNQYFLNDGTVNAGGSITFYETDLTTLKDTYSDPSLSTVNSNPVVLDSAGRLSTDVWGSGNYGAVIKNSAGTVIETRNNIQSGAGTDQSIPALTIGDFLTNDGSNLLWQPVLQVPDPTDYSGYVLYSDGTSPYWAPAITIGSGSNSAQIGDILIQTGTGTVPASGATTAVKSFTFPTPFSVLWHVEASINAGSGLTALGFLPNFSVNGRSVNGATLNLDTNGAGSDTPITAATSFSWFAIGKA